MKGAYNSVNALYNSDCLTNQTNEVNYAAGSAKVNGNVYETQTGGGYSPGPATFGNAFEATRDFIGVGECDVPTVAATVTQKAGRRRRRSSSRRKQKGGNKVPNQPIWGDKVQINHPGNQTAGHVNLDGKPFSAVADPFRVLPGAHAARITGDLNAYGYEGISTGKYGGGKRRTRRTRRTRRKRRTRRTR